jgi:methylated-DNA-protein-cysteine methyltransferase-like protein
VKPGRRTARGAEGKESRHRRFYRVVERIPEGKVATYGQVAALAGFPRNARLVGYALASLPDGSDVPWQRVVNARGEVSLRAADDLGASGFQRHLLEEEGVVFGLDGRIDFERYLWRPRARTRTAAAPAGKGRRGGWTANRSDRSAGST